MKSISKITRRTVTCRLVSKMIISIFHEVSRFDANHFTEARNFLKRILAIFPEFSYKTLT